jgi:hypothetical protein
MLPTAPTPSRTFSPTELPATMGPHPHHRAAARQTWAKAAELDLGQSPTLPGAGHPSGNGLPVPNGSFASVNAAVFVAPCAAGVAISNDGNMLVVANYYNDSITVFTGGLSHLGAQSPIPNTRDRCKADMERWPEPNSTCALARPFPIRVARHGGRRISVLGGGDRRRNHEALDRVSTRARTPTA